MNFIAEWALPIVVVTMIIFMLMFAVHRDWGKLMGITIIGMGIVVPVVSAIVFIPSTHNSDQTSTTVTTATSSTNNSSHTHFDYTLLLTIAGGLVALIVIAGLAYITAQYAKGKKAIINANNEQKLAEFKRLAELDKHLTREWNDLVIKHTNILDEWNSYDKDIKKLLALPAMRNFELPEIGAVIDALDAANDAKRLQYPKGIESVQGTEYCKAVKNCEHAFEEAIHTAINHKNKVMPSKERKALALANQLLKTAMNESASANERQLAYTRIIDIMEDLHINIPKGVIQQIENHTRLLLEA